ENAVVEIARGRFASGRHRKLHVVETVHRHESVPSACPLKSVFGHSRVHRRAVLPEDSGTPNTGATALHGRTRTSREPAGTLRAPDGTERRGAEWTHRLQPRPLREVPR